MSIGPLFSSVWFPENQRTTSTAIISCSNLAGTAITFILGPNLVPDSASISINDTK